MCMLHDNNNSDLVPNMLFTTAFNSSVPQLIKICLYKVIVPALKLQGNRCVRII